MTAILHGNAVRAARTLICLPVLLIIGFSCGPKIKAFDVNPTYVQPGDSVQISWSVRGKASLMAWRGSPIVATPGQAATLLFADSLPKKGTCFYPIYEETELILSAVKGDDTAHWPISVRCFSESAWVDTIYLPTDIIGTDSLIAFVDLFPDLPSNVLVEQVWLIPERSATFFHSERKEEVVDSSDAFAGLPARGEWMVRTRRLANEPFGTGPEELLIGIRLTIRR